MCPREGQVGPRRERRTHRLAGRHWATTLVGGGRGRKVDIRPSCKSWASLSFLSEKDQQSYKKKWTGGREWTFVLQKFSLVVILVWKKINNPQKKRELVGHYSIGGAGTESGHQPVFNFRRSWKLLSFLSQEIQKSQKRWKSVAHYKSEGWAKRRREEEVRSWISFSSFIL